VLALSPICCSVTLSAAACPPGVCGLLSSGIGIPFLGEK
jgi:hypothetical protein